MKNFKDWSNLKEHIHDQPDQTIPYFREGEIWWSRLGVNIGFEQDGKNEEFMRPVLILKKFNPFIFWALPLSTKCKNNPYLYKM